MITTKMLGFIISLCSIISAVTYGATNSNKVGVSHVAVPFVTATYEVFQGKTNALSSS